jgi:hypothetical protein
MRSLTTAADRFRAARGLSATLDAACDAFEQILAVIAACEQASTSTGLAITFLFAATQAANGRDAMLFAPSLPPVARHAPAPAEQRLQPNTQDIRAPIAGLAELLAGGLGRTAATAAAGADRAACHDAAACATRIHDLLTRRPGL